MICHYIDRRWVAASSGDALDIVNPATGETLDQVPLGNAEAVRAAVEAASAAFEPWRATPAVDRIQFLFRFKTLLEENLDDLAQTVTLECGKTVGEARGELRRGIENVEVACGVPSLMQGYNNEDIARGIDEHMIRQPLGVVAAITPFNFPGMIPLWFLPYAIACGNCFILKPSEKTPLTAVRLFELLHATGLPAGVAGLVHGQGPTAESLIDAPEVRAVSFVGSTDVARSIYLRAASHGKRVQCQGGAKNTVVVLPDAELQSTLAILAESAFGCAGQRCLAASQVIAVGDAIRPLQDGIAEMARARRVGFGLDPDVEMGPMIDDRSRQRVLSLLDEGLSEGAEIHVDGRSLAVDGYGDGSFLFPTILSDVQPQSRLAKTELFGPVLSVLHAANLAEAIDLVNQSAHGNMACLFTASGAAARTFRRDVHAGNVGINVGVAAPMAFFPFSGAKQSFFGDLHAQGRHGVEFYTETKVVVERWP